LTGFAPWPPERREGEQRSERLPGEHIKKTHGSPGISLSLGEALGAAESEARCQIERKPLPKDLTERNERNGEPISELVFKDRVTLALAVAPVFFMTARRNPNLWLADMARGGHLNARILLGLVFSSYLFFQLSFSFSILDRASRPRKRQKEKMKKR